MSELWIFFCLEIWDSWAVLTSCIGQAMSRLLNSSIDYQGVLL
jgi:hypothetical protein